MVKTESIRKWFSSDDSLCAIYIWGYTICLQQKKRAHLRIFFPMTRAGNSLGGQMQFGANRSRLIFWCMTAWLQFWWAAVLEEFSWSLMACPLVQLMNSVEGGVIEFVYRTITMAHWRHEGLKEHKAWLRSKGFGMLPLLDIFAALDQQLNLFWHVPQYHACTKLFDFTRIIVLPADMDLELHVRDWNNKEWE